MKIIEKPLPSGKWRFHLAGDLSNGNYRVEGVYLKGLRNRPWPLEKVDKDEYFRYHNPNEAVVVRGMPSKWTYINGLLYLWPAPAHDWTLQLRLVSK